MKDQAESGEYAAIAERTDPCVCEHLPLVHRGVIVGIDGHPKADYATLLGSCGSCSCPRFEPRSGSTLDPYDYPHCEPCALSDHEACTAASAPGRDCCCEPPDTGRQS